MAICLAMTPYFESSVMDRVKMAMVIKWCCNHGVEANKVADFGELNLPERNTEPGKVGQENVCTYLSSYKSYVGSLNPLMSLNFQ